MTSALVRQPLLAARHWVRHASYLRKWIVLGALIGIIAGVGAIVFLRSLELATYWLVGLVAGYYPPSPVGEGSSTITSIARPWLLPVIVGLGGLVSGFIIFRWAPEAEGHGTDAAIAAFHEAPKRIRTRVPIIKVVASAITIGSGGSGGREGPTAQISAGFGSLLARILDLDARDARIAVAVGIGSGIGAIFRAPLGGAVLAAEVLYRDDVEAEALVPAFIASIVGYAIFGSVMGFNPMFGAHYAASFDDPRQLFYYAVLGIVSGVAGYLYVRGFYGLTYWFRSWTIPQMIRPAIAGVAVGLIGIVLPGSLGTGYGWLQQGFTAQALMAIPLWVILLLPFAKILTTGLSIGSGGSGGIFGPGMVIGGLLGAGVWRLLEPIVPGLPPDPAPFVIVGMMATFGSAAHAPLAVMLMVAEMTGNLSMLAPALVAVGLATFVVGDRTIYSSQLRSRADSPAHRFRYAMPLMASLSAGDAARAARVVLRRDERVADARRRLEEADMPGAPVVDADGHLRGVVSSTQLRAGDAAAKVESVATGDPVSVEATEGLDDALDTISRAGLRWVPVTYRGGLAGVLSVRDVMAAYRAAMTDNVRRLRGLGDGTALLEATLGNGSPLAGQPVSAAAWPRNAVVVAIQREHEVLIPRGDTVLQPGDRLAVLTTPSAEASVRDLLDAETAPDSSADELGDDVGVGEASGIAALGEAKDGEAEDGLGVGGSDDGSG